MNASCSMRANLTAQGFALTDRERSALWLGLRFSTGVCLALVVIALALQSAVLLAFLVPVGAVAGFTARHPFDYVWNGAVRHVVGGPPLPPNPTRRRHAFKLSTAWLATLAVLFAAGAQTAGLILGGLLVAACATVTTMNFCIPSEALAWWERRHRRREALTT